MTDTPIHVTRWGTTGPRIVMVHGSAQGSMIGGDRHFAAQERLGARGYRVIVPDRPGHGRSPDPGRPDDPVADGKLVATLLEDGAHLVGHSFGGCVALAAAAMRPEAVRSLTLIEPAMIAVAAGEPAARKFLIRLVMATVFSLSDTARAKKFNQLVGIPQDLRDADEAVDVARIGRALKRIKLPSKQELITWLEGVKAARIPLLVMTGGWNPAFEVSSDEVARLGGGRRMIIPSQHHFPQNISDEFNLELARLVDEISMSGAQMSQREAQPG